MGIGIWILGNQLSLGQAALQRHQRQRQHIPVILIESRQLAQERPYHRQKLLLVWSAMRHFAQDLKAAGWSITYETAANFDSPLRQWVSRHDMTDLHLI